MILRSFIFTVTLVCAASGPVTAQDYAVVDVEGAASIRGRVTLSGDAPAPLQLLITKDVEICGLGYRERTEVDVDDTNGLRNVVVYIEEITEGKGWDRASTGDFINQEICRFQPHIQVMRRAVDIDIINSDATLHNIHAYELLGRARRSLFNISQPEMGAVPQLMHPRSGNRVSLECDSHDFMQGWVFVADNPYSVVVDDSGNFELSQVPPGAYTVSVWHPKLGVQSREITISGPEGAETNFEYVLD